MKKSAALLMGILFILAFGIFSQEKEITEYQGQKLTPLRNQKTTHIEELPEVDLSAYRLKIEGKVRQPLELRYEEVLALPQESKVITMNCVEGWNYRALWTGIKISDLIAQAQHEPEAKTVIFYAIGGKYSSALPLETIKEKKILLAFKVNNITLPPERGFPFMVVAEEKYGYKWVQWVEKIALSDKEYKGYWEKRGYSNKADIRK
jgi:DMSO/TMAO reductase YedYZ molybdopterin-dependent catalytic subunit